MNYMEATEATLQAILDSLMAVYIMGIRSVYNEKDGPTQWAQSLGPDYEIRYMKASSGMVVASSDYNGAGSEYSQLIEAKVLIKDATPEQIEIAWSLWISRMVREKTKHYKLVKDECKEG